MQTTSQTGAAETAMTDAEAMRIVLEDGATGSTINVTTVGEFLRDNPMLVDDWPADRLVQVLQHRERLEFGGGAEPWVALRLYDESKAAADQTAQAVDEILRAATAWYGDAVPVKWLAVMPAMRAAPGLLAALSDLYKNVDTDMHGYWTESTANLMQQADEAIQAAKGGAS